MAWNSVDPTTGLTGYKLGETQRDPSSYLGLSYVVKMNEEMLNHSSMLMIAAAAIHETFHAYTQNRIYQFAYDAGTQDSTTSRNWCNDLDHFLNMMNTPANTIDQAAILSDYFSQAIDCLQTLDNFQHTPKEYAEAMLYGLDVNDANSTVEEKAHLTTLYNNMLATYQISASDFNSFKTAQVINSSGVNKLPTGCPI